MLLQQGFWTESRVNELRNLWGSGLSATQCGMALGASRSAIIGKVTRLGISHTHSNLPRLPSSDSHETKARRHHPPSRQFDMINDFEIPATQRCSISELTNWTCRWPVGNPCEHEFFYCGSSAANYVRGHPYCPMHEQRAFSPRLPRIKSVASSQNPIAQKTGLNGHSLG